MQTNRRQFLQQSSLAVLALSGAGLGLMSPAFAAKWNQKLFKQRNLRQLMQQLGFDRAQASNRIKIGSPHLSEIGARVPLKITSEIPGTESISLVVDKNHNPLAYQTTIPKDGVAFIATNVKMAQTSTVHVLVRANGKLYKQKKLVKVVIGGC